MYARDLDERDTLLLAEYPSPTGLAAAATDVEGRRRAAFLSLVARLAAPRLAQRASRLHTRDLLGAARCRRSSRRDSPTTAGGSPTNGNARRSHRGGATTIRRLDEWGCDVPPNYDRSLARCPGVGGNRPLCSWPQYRPPAQAPAETSITQEVLGDGIYLLRAPSALDRWTATNVVVIVNEQDVTVFDSNTRPSRRAW